MGSYKNILRIATIVVSISGKTSKFFRNYMNPYKEFYLDTSESVDINIILTKDCNDDDGFESVLFEDKDNFVFEQYIHPDGRMKVRAEFGEYERIMIASPDFKYIKTNSLLENPHTAYILDRFILISFIARAVDFNILKIHSSAIYKDNKAIAFLGVSGTGKSTHSSLWLKYIENAKLLNDDEPFVKVEKNGFVTIYGAPWSGSTKCYKNISIPLKAIVHLEQNKENILHKQSIIESINSLLISVNTLKMYKGMKVKQYKIILDLLTHVPTYNLKCRADREAVVLTNGIIE